MKILITNDDGIDSPFLTPLAEVFAKNHDILIAAPASEQSWIGKAMSRRGHIDMKTVDRFPCPAYSLSGTPGDCVNIALGHLCEEAPDLVISGINIGHNAGLSFVTSSGTIGGALEAALHNLPAIAASMYLEPDSFQAVCQRDQPLSERIDRHIRQAAVILETFAASFIEIHDPKYGHVHSLNFPHKDLNGARILKSRTARTVTRSLFERDQNRFRFAYQPLETLEDEAHPTDRKHVHQGDISHTILDYASIDQSK